MLIQLEGKHVLQVTLDTGAPLRVMVCQMDVNGRTLTPGDRTALRDRLVEAFRAEELPITTDVLPAVKQAGAPKKTRATRAPKAPRTPRATKTPKAPKAAKRRTAATAASRDLPRASVTTAAAGLDKTEAGATDAPASAVRHPGPRPVPKPGGTKPKGRKGAKRTAKR